MKSGCKKQLPVCCEVVDFVQKINLRQKYPNLFQAVRGWIDTVMCASLACSRDEHCNDDDFVASRRKQCELLLDPTSLRTVYNNRKDLPKASAELSVLCSSSHFGAKLFLADMEKVLSLCVATIIMEVVNRRFTVADLHVDDSVVDAVKEECMAQVNKMAGIEFLPASRKVVFDYRSAELCTLVGSHAEQIDIVVWSVIKTRGRDLNKVVEMWGESSLVPAGYESAWKFTVDDALLTATNMARKAASQHITDLAVATSDTIQQCMKARKCHLKQLDKRFGIEHAIVNELIGDRSVKRLRLELMSKLPTADRIVTPSAVAAAVVRLQSGELYKLAPRTAQEKTKAALDILNALAEGRVPALRDACQCDFLKEFVASLQFFLRLPDTADDGATLIGKDCFESLIATAKHKLADKTATMDDTAALKTYSWLCPAEHDADRMAIVKGIDDHVDKASDINVAKKKATASKGGSSSSSFSGTDTAAKKAASFFE